MSKTMTKAMIRICHRNQSYTFSMERYTLYHYITKTNFISRITTTDTRNNVT